jgi:hypothetical protein
VYLNGTAGTEVTPTAPRTAAAVADFTLGKSPGFDGAIDSFKIWDFNIGQSGVNEDYAGGAGIFYTYDWLHSIYDGPQFAWAMKVFEVHY